MPETVTIPAQFNGPLDRGNGGYSAGVVASLVGGAAEVSLRRAVPLDTPLDAAPDEDGLVAEGHAVPDLAIDVPEPVSIDDARAAEAGYRGLRGEVFSRCFVCGLDRDDAFGVFAGAVDGRDVVASTWTPPEWTAGD